MILNWKSSFLLLENLWCWWPIVDIDAGMLMLSPTSMKQNLVKDITRKINRYNHEERAIITFYRFGLKFFNLSEISYKFQSRMNDFTEKLFRKCPTMTHQVIVIWTVLKLLQVLLVHTVIIPNRVRPKLSIFSIWIPDIIRNMVPFYSFSKTGFQTDAY